MTSSSVGKRIPVVQRNQWQTGNKVPTEGKPTAQAEKLNCLMMALLNVFFSNL